MPIYGKPMSMDDVIARLSSPDALEDIAYALRDWSEAISLLDLNGAPDLDENGVRPSMWERIIWLMENVSYENIKQA
jgi:hypothetical protein